MMPVIWMHTFVGGDFSACKEAERALSAAGYSIGRMQGPDPRGILYGDYDIQKWRNLSRQDRSELHGTMYGSMRNGPVTVRLTYVPEAAHAALEAAISAVAA